MHRPEPRIVAVTDRTLVALKRAKVDPAIIEVARAAGTMRKSPLGWSVQGYLGAVMNDKQAKVFERALDASN